MGFFKLDDDDDNGESLGFVTRGAPVSPPVVASLLLFLRPSFGDLGRVVGIYNISTNHTST